MPRPSKPIKPIPPETLEEMAKRYQQGDTLDALSYDYPWGRTTIGRALKDTGLPMRARGIPPGQTRTHDYKALADDYRAGMTQRQVADKYACSTHTVYRACIIEGVPTRQRGER